MKTSSKLSKTAVVIWSFFCACALMATAYFLKGNPVQYWIESAIFVVAVTLIIWNSRGVERIR